MKIVELIKHRNIIFDIYMFLILCIFCISTVSVMLLTLSSVIINSIVAVPPLICLAFLSLIGIWFCKKMARFINNYYDGNILQESQDDYILKPGIDSAWITVDNTSIHIQRKPDRVSVLFYGKGCETMGEISGAYAYNTESEKLVKFLKDGIL